jgi:hypothetical protein
MILLYSNLRGNHLMHPGESPSRESDPISDRLTEL